MNSTTWRYNKNGEACCHGNCDEPHLRILKLNLVTNNFLFGKMLACGSLVTRPSHHPVFDRLQYFLHTASNQNWTLGRPGNDARFGTGSYSASFNGCYITKPEITLRIQVKEVPQPTGLKDISHPNCFHVNSRKTAWFPVSMVTEIKEN